MTKRDYILIAIILTISIITQFNCNRAIRFYTCPAQYVLDEECECGQHDAIRVD